MLLDEFGQLMPTTSVCYWHSAGLPELCEYAAGECPIGSPFEELSVVVEQAGRPVGGQLKDLSEVTDLTSTGRKRAAMLYPIFPASVCDWSGLAKAGGGPDPIVGCRGNLIFPSKDRTAGNVHHGPDKNTLNNSPSNTHRICWSCHQTWHARNNRYYGKRPEGQVPYLPLDDVTWYPHDPDTWATEEQLLSVSVQRESVNPRVEDWTRRGVIPEPEWIV